MKQILLIIVIVFSVSGCYKTVYMNVQGDKAPTKMTIEQLENVSNFDNSEWYHYFVSGLLPSERIIAADKKCGGAENILSINTQQTFLQAGVAFLTSYYMISIYSPYSGYVVCDKTKVVKVIDTK